jgi:hypothetical protein
MMKAKKKKRKLVKGHAVGGAENALNSSSAIFRVQT